MQSESKQNEPVKTDRPDGAAKALETIEPFLDETLDWLSGGWRPLDAVLGIARDCARAIGDAFDCRELFAFNVQATLHKKIDTILLMLGQLAKRLASPQLEEALGLGLAFHQKCRPPLKMPEKDVEPFVQRLRQCLERIALETECLGPNEIKSVWPENPLTWVEGFKRKAAHVTSTFKKLADQLKGLKGTCESPQYTTADLAALHDVLAKDILVSGETQALEDGILVKIATQKPDPDCGKAREDVIEELNRFLKEASKCAKKAGSSTILVFNTLQNALNGNQLSAAAKCCTDLETAIPKLIEDIFAAHARKPPAERGYFSDVNLHLLFDVHANTIRNWRNGQSAPEGFHDAILRQDYEAMSKCAEKYVANRRKADAMNTKGLVRNLSEEALHRQRLVV